MQTEHLIILIVIAIAALITLGYVFILFKKVSKIEVKNQKVDEISKYIFDGAMAFLKREFKVIIPFVLAFALLLTLLGFIPALAGKAEAVGWQSALCFLVGATFSGIAGWIGMFAATKSNARTAMKANEEGMSSALRVAFSGGAILGLSVASLGLLGLIILFLIAYALGNIELAVKVVAGYGLGCSMIALFARVGGGIYTKAADVGADLVGKVESGLPEDDPRNPATIADNVGDNVGDIAGMGSDLTESYVGSIVSALTMALFTITDLSNLSALRIIMFPLMIAGIGALASALSVMFIRMRNWENPHKALNIATYVATGLVVVGSLILSVAYVGDIKLFFAVLAGLLAGIAVGFIAEIYTSSDYSEVKKIAYESQTGHATNIIAGLGTGMKSTALTIAALALAIIISYICGGGYGIALAAVGMLSTAGITVSVDGYGPISDNAGGIAQMAALPKEVRGITDKLDSVGNTTAAIGKGFCIGSATLTSLALIVSYTHSVGINEIELQDPKFIVGLLIGAMLPYLFSALTIASVGKAANKMVEEVRAQFEADPGILAGTSTPNYIKCIDISTKASLKEMILPGVIAIVSPILGGLIFGADGLAGILIGGLVSAIMLAVFMANAGGAWDNAKKYIEEGNFGGKGSETHHASVTGDTVGDPLKDTAGPAMDILIKLNKKEILDILFRLAIVIFSNLLLSFATVWFLEPADLYSGGATGTAQLVQRFFKLFNLDINLGLLIFMVNIPIVLIGFKYVSKKFAIYSIVAVIVQSLGVAFIKGSPFQDLINPIVVSTASGNVETLNYGGILTLAIWGGLLGGAASGIALRYGTSTGGIDVAAQAFALKQNVSIGNFTMIFNVALAIIGGGLLQGSWIIAIFTCIRMILNSLVTDKIHTAYTYTSLHIFTTHSLEISAEIMKELQRGCTFYDVEGAYSHVHSKEVYCVVSRWEAEKALKIVRKYDPKAFVSMAPVKRVNGNFKRKSII